MKFRVGESRGFTIVELLIVIVVIAILAAITIVSYNGITTNAENTKTVNAVAAHGRAILAYKAANGAYPIVSYTCFGPAGTKCSNTTNTTGACFGAGQATTQTTYLTQIATIASNLPAPSTQGASCAGVEYGGAWYHSTDGITGTVVYFLKGSVDCTNIAGLVFATRQQQDGATFCRFNLP